MSIHFEELWEKCELLHKEISDNDDASILCNELILKLNLYKTIDLKNDLDETERKKIKSRTMGEILLTITNLSLKDDINVFEALNLVYQYRSIDLYSKKY